MTFDEYAEMIAKAAAQIHDVLLIDARLQECRKELADLRERYEGVVEENERMSTALNSIATALSTR